MTHPAPSSCSCGEHAAKKPLWQGESRVVLSEPLATDTWRLRFDAPAIANCFVPGQFVMLRLPGTRDPLLGRPLAIYDAGRGDDVGLSNTASALTWIDVVYLVVGKATQRMTALRPGETLEVWGPLGNGFPVVDCDHLILVAGGIGQTPMLPVVKHRLGTANRASQARGTAPDAASAVRAPRISLCYGARSIDYLAGLEDFRRTGITVHLSTDDGSLGHHGRVTELIEPLIDPAERTHLFCCGPDPMLAATVALADRLAVPCHVSLETPMACGLGICYSCVTKVRQPAGGWDYRRVCVEGPVFDARELDPSVFEHR